MQDLLRAWEARRKLAGPTSGLAVPLSATAAAYAAPGAEVQSTDDAALSATFVISTEDLDRSGDVVISEGCLPHIDSYRRNPVVLFNHGPNEPGGMHLPIGKSEDDHGNLTVRVEPGLQVTATCHFSRTLKEAQDVYWLVRERILRTASIGFLPHKAHKIDDATKAHAEDRDRHRGGYLIEEWELLEWSPVLVPDNPACEMIRACLSRDRISEKGIPVALRKALEPYAAPSPAWSPGATLPPAGPSRTEPVKVPDMSDAAATADATVPEVDVTMRTDGGMVKVAPAARTKALDDPLDETTDPDELTDDTLDDDGPGDEPLGATVLREYLEHLRAGCKYLEQHLAVLEPDTKVKAWAESEQSACEEAVATLTEMAGEYYPDSDFGEAEGPDDEADEEAEDLETPESEDEAEDDPGLDGASEGDEDDLGLTPDSPEAEKDLGTVDDAEGGTLAGEDDEEEESDDEEEDDLLSKYTSLRRRPYLKRLNKSGMACVKDAAQYMSKIADHSEMPGWMVQGHKGHSMALCKMLDGMEGRPVDDEPADEDTDAEDEERDDDDAETKALAELAEVKAELAAVRKGLAHARGAVDD